jgi:hypothetical protein
VSTLGVSAPLLAPFADLGGYTRKSSAGWIANPPSFVRPADNRPLSIARQIVDFETPASAAACRSDSAFIARCSSEMVRTMKSQRRKRFVNGGLVWDQWTLAHADTEKAEMNATDKTRGAFPSMSVKARNDLK